MLQNCNSSSVPRWATADNTESGHDWKRVGWLLEAGKCYAWDSSQLQNELYLLGSATSGAERNRLGFVKVELSWTTTSDSHPSFWNVFHLKYLDPDFIQASEESSLGSKGELQSILGFSKCLDKLQQLTWRQKTWQQVSNKQWTCAMSYWLKKIMWQHKEEVNC